MNQDSIGLFAIAVTGFGYGLCNIFMLPVVQWLSYKRSLVIGALLMLPYFLLALYLYTVDSVLPVLKWAFWGACALQAAGQSIIWIAQGCYIPASVFPALLPKAFSIFSFLYSLSIPIGSGIMAVFSYTGIDLSVSLIVTVALAIVGALLLGFGCRPVPNNCKPAEKSSAWEAIRQSWRAIPAMLYFGTFLYFTSKLQGIYAHDLWSFFVSFIYGLSLCVVSAVASLSMQLPALRKWFACCSLLHAASYFFLFSMAVWRESFGSLFLAAVVVLAVGLGAADAIFITAIYSFLSERFSANLDAVMTLFMVLNGIPSGVFGFIEFPLEVWAIMLAVMATTAYTGILLF